MGRSLLLVDDHGLVRHGLQLLVLEVMPAATVEVAASLAEARQQLGSRTRFDLVLLDLTLDDVHGMAGLASLRNEFPYVPVVVCSAQDDRDTVLAALDHGAMGFISKAATPEELRTALHQVLAEGRVHLPRSVSQRALRAETQGARPLSDLAGLGLTERQIEVLGLVVQGLRNKEIARALGISEVMVKKHITPALQALGVPDRTKLLVTLNAHGYAVGVGRAT